MKQKSSLKVLKCSILNTYKSRNVRHNISPIKKKNKKQKADWVSVYGLSSYLREIKSSHTKTIRFALLHRTSKTKQKYHLEILSAASVHAIS